jgi:hypothetical protein
MNNELMNLKHCVRNDIYYFYGEREQTGWNFEDKVQIPPQRQVIDQ